MLKYLFTSLIILSFSNSFSQNLKEKDSLAIINVLETQRVAWNNNNIEDFMEGYLIFMEQDSLKIEAVVVVVGKL